ADRGLDREAAQVLVAPAEGVEIDRWPEHRCGYGRSGLRLADPRGGNAQIGLRSKGLIDHSGELFIVKSVPPSADVFVLRDARGGIGPRGVRRERRRQRTDERSA